MKPSSLSMRIIFFLLFTGCTAILQAQDGLNAAQYQALKQLRIANPERETYLVFDEAGFILDRYEMKPASVFRFSDSVERRLYLYLVYPADREDTVGLFIYYQRQDRVIALPVPGQTADKAAWALYLDDLKYTGEAEPGWLATVSFLLSKELAGLLEGKSAPIETEDDYEYCFPAETMIALPEGKSIPVSLLQPGMQILGLMTNDLSPCLTTVRSVSRHQASGIDLVRLTGLETETQLAGAGEEPALLRSLELTGNHPVWTSRGKLPARDLRPGDKLFVRNGQQARALTLVAVEPQARTVGEVWTIETEKDEAFWAENLLVLPK